MLQILLIIGIIGLIILGFQFIRVILALALIALAIYLYVSFIGITLPITIGIIAIYVLLMIYYFIKQKLDKEKQKKLSEKNKIVNQQFLKNNKTIYSDEEIDLKLSSFIQEIKENDTNKKDYIFDQENMPYGRVNAFLNYFNKSIYEEDPYYFSVIPSKNLNEMREYGIAITREGTYVSLQKQDNEGKCYCQNEYIPFSGLLRADNTSNGIDATYIEKDYDSKKILLEVPNNINSNTLLLFCRAVIVNKVSVSLFIKSKLRNESLSQSSAKINNIPNNNNPIKSPISKLVWGEIVTAPEKAKIFGEFGQKMNARQKGGYAAEYANISIDRMKYKDVQGEMKDEFNRPLKNGADRIVNGVEIQTKYYKTASESISAAFDDGTARYLRHDSSGKMMLIEVPRDQYSKAIELMQKRIDSGQVPGVKPGENASDYVKKGYCTYQQAQNVALAGTVEGIFIDTINGIRCSAVYGGISMLCAFSLEYGKEKDIEKAAQAGIAAGISSIGQQTVTFVLCQQLTRGSVKVFSYELKNPVESIVNNISQKINSSGFSRSLGGKEITDKSIIMGAIMYGPELYNFLSGKISFEQCFKNTATIAGASIIGGALAPISIVGSIIGSFVGGYVVRNILDQFIEDDSKKMFQILKEEFLDMIVLSGLNEEEINQAVESTLANPQLEDILKNMYQCGSPREYAKNVIMQETIVTILSHRPKITEKMFEEGISQVMQNKVA